MGKAEKRHFLTDNNKHLCDHGGLHPTKEIKGKYTSGKSYNQMKELFTKYWKE